jgi:nucleoside-diphosphate-sugar epimerase
MMRVFVTGGSGYLGRHLIAELVAQGNEVVAMARSDRAAERVAALGSKPALGGLDHVAGLDGCAVVIHAASRFMQPGDYATYARDNIEGTRTLLQATRAAGVQRFVYVGAAGCLVGGRPVVGADETWPLQQPSWSHYFKTKSIADGLVRAADAPGFATSVVRPGLIWGGEGDTFTASIAEVTRAGHMMLIDGGRHEIVTSHVANTVAGVLAAMHRALGGEAYFVFDDGAITTRDFLGRLMESQGLELPDKAISGAAAWAMANAMAAAWRLLGRKDDPPLTRELVKLNGGPFLVSDEKARSQLGYLPVVSRDRALADLKALAEAPGAGSSRSAAARPTAT